VETGSVAPRAQGGDTRSGRIEAHGPAILAMVGEAPDITLVEIAERLEQDREDVAAARAAGSRLSLTCSPEGPSVTMRVRHQETDNAEEQVHRGAYHRRAA